jgi:predicted DNA-binding protein with PD1-like motif
MDRNRSICGTARPYRIPRRVLPGREREQETMNDGAESAGLFEYDTCKHLMVRFRQDADLIRSITELARRKGIEAGSFTAIGALKRAKLGYYDQKNRKYREMMIAAPHELVSCVGNVSLSEGKPFVHAHVVLGDEKGNTKAGHLLEGIVFAAEVHLRQLEGPKLERKLDEVTNLWLWEEEQRAGWDEQYPRTAPNQPEPE